MIPRKMIQVLDNSNLTHPEQVLDVPVVFPWQVLVLQKVPDSVKPLRVVVQPASLQPVRVEVSSKERLRELPEIRLDGGGEEVVVSRLQARQGVQPSCLKLCSQAPHLPVTCSQSERRY